jgi:hypothetical protein
LIKAWAQQLAASSNCLHVISLLRFSAGVRSMSAQSAGYKRAFLASISPIWISMAMFSLLFRPASFAVVSAVKKEREDFYKVFGAPIYTIKQGALQ